MYLGETEVATSGTRLSHFQVKHITKNAQNESLLPSPHKMSLNLIQKKSLGANLKDHKTQIPYTWQWFVSFFGWLSDTFQRLSDLQIGDKKVTLNHLV